MLARRKSPGLVYVLTAAGVPAARGYDGSPEPAPAKAWADRPRDFRRSKAHGNDVQSRAPLSRHARACSTAVRFRISTRALRPWAATSLPPPRVTPALRHCCPVQAIGGSAPTVGDKIGRCRRPAARPSLSSCPDLFRVSTSLRRFVRSRLAPRCRKTWIPGTSPGMTVGGMPARRSPCLASSDPLEPRSYPRLSPGQAHPNRTPVEQVRASTFLSRLARPSLTRDAVRRGYPEQVRA